MVWKYSVINFSFNQVVSVTEYFFPDFSFSEFLSSMGGAMGSWLGLGVLQLTTTIATVFKWIKSLYSSIQLN